MGRPVPYHRKCAGVVVLLLGLWTYGEVVVPAESLSAASSLAYSKNAYAYPQATYHSSGINTSASAFEPRDSGGGGGSSFGTTGGSYGVPGGELDCLSIYFSAFVVLNLKT